MTRKVEEIAKDLRHINISVSARENQNQIFLVPNLARDKHGMELNLTME